MKTEFSIQKTLAQRGPVERLPESSVTGILLVGNHSLYRGEENHSHYGCDLVELYPAVHNGQHAFLLVEEWSPAEGYSASGIQETILPLEEGVKFLVEQGAFEHLWTDE